MDAIVNYVPLINNLVNPTYKGFTAKPGETPAHLAKRPLLNKINGKKILYVTIGASTPGQISTSLVTLTSAFNNVKVVNGCTGSMDINDWLDINSTAWSNLEDAVLRAGYEMNEVQGVIMCHDDLKDTSVLFPSAPQAMASKLESLIVMMKGIFPALKVCELFSRLYGGFITDPKFAIPSCYHTTWANKFVTEKAISTNSLIAGVWVSDGVGDLWTVGETTRSDGFYMKKVEMKQRGTSVHIDTRTGLDERCANKILTGLKRYPDFK